MQKTFREFIKLGLVIVALGQLIFALYSPRYLEPSFQGRIYATTGVKHRQEDLHKLNEAAHYFGQTIIGWLKFPSFMSDLNEYVELPSGSLVSAHIQERQNIIFTLSSNEEPNFEVLERIKDFIQSKLDEYNSVSQTEFVLTNLDYEITERSGNYFHGAIITLFVTLVLNAALIYIRLEFKR